MDIVPQLFLHILLIAFPVNALQKTNSLIIQCSVLPKVVKGSVKVSHI